MGGRRKKSHPRLHQKEDEEQREPALSAVESLSADSERCRDFRSAGKPKGDNVRLSSACKRTQCLPAVHMSAGHHNESTT